MKSTMGRAKHASWISSAALATAGLCGQIARADLAKDWGYNGYGQLGNGTNTDSNIPIAPTNLSSGVSAVAAGAGHTLAIQNGGILAWGYNFDGELGDGAFGNTSNSPYNTSSVAVVGLTSGVTAIAAGYEHSLALQSGAVYAWGFNGDGELGNGTTTSSDVPVAVSNLSNGVTAIAAGAAGSLAIKNGGVYAWGNNTYGQLGNGTFNASNTPVSVPALSSGVSAVGCGAWQNLAIKNGSLYAWGDNANGQLGDGTTTNLTVPQVLSGFSSGVTAIAGGWGHSIVVQNGSVYAWGSNYLGQLGDGTSSDDDSPERIDPTDLTNIVSVAAAEYSSYALSSDGSLWDWGYNANGELGIGSTTLDFRTPQHLLAPAGYVYTSISADALGNDAVATLAPVALSVASGQEYQFNAGTGSGVLVRTINGILINANASAILAPASSHANRQLLVDSSVLDLVGYAGHWSGLLDVGNNDLDLQDSSLATVNDQVHQGFAGGKWNGAGGVASASAAADTRHLTALGVIQNNQSGVPIYTSSNKFDGTSPGVSDILVKCTYYGDANLDGKVDASDYSLIDNGYLNHLTGWYNGDFNYDGVINGSDYTLIDNAFNMQGAALSSQVAGSTQQLASVSAAAVPEPASLSLLIVGAVGLLGRRFHRARSGDSSACKARITTEGILS